MKINYAILALLLSGLSLLLIPGCKKEPAMVVPTITLTPVTNITATTATSGGEITSDGGSSITARGVCWGTTSLPSITGNKTNDGTSAGKFTSTITGLTAGTTYYIRSYATNGVGTVYSNQTSFTTGFSLEFNSSTEKLFIKHEFRAAWLTTVGNYDWPPKNATPEAQRTALISIISRLKELNFNVVLFHIRPTSDAFYFSQLVPWSVYLTGTQGVYPGFDPLAVAIEECHSRGMELHGWLNPYRIGSTSIVLASNHPMILHPEWCLLGESPSSPGTFNRYLNPGIPAVKNHLLAVVKEIIDNYNIDGIHFDDYFYPDGAKPTASQTDPYKYFNDKATFEQYGGSLDINCIWGSG